MSCLKPRRDVTLTITPSPLYDCDGTCKRHYSDCDAETIQVAKMYDPTNPRHTDREIGRYLQACHKTFGSSRSLALAGPDGTKVGSDFCISSGFFMEPVRKKVCVAATQVPTIVFHSLTRTIHHGYVRFLHSIRTPPYNRQRSAASNTLPRARPRAPER